jgi:spore coat polysaccharide biosynthesis protein SpsF (cytidylyltransferase family)
MARALAIVQARMSSTRLPGKSVAVIGGEPMLALLLRRLQRVRELQRIVVATSTEPSDDTIEEVAGEVGTGVYRGALDDVLTRFEGAASGHPGPLVRVTADCPLIDPVVVDDAIRLFERTPGCAYASNVEPRSYPVGLDVEVFSAATLEWAGRMTEHPADREHVTTLMRRNVSQFPSAALTCEEQLSDLRWSVESVEDLDFVRAIVARLGPRRHAAGFREILTTVRRDPSLARFHGCRG